MNLLQWLTGRETPGYLQRVRAMAIAEDKKAVGPLAKTLESRDSEVRKMAEVGLTHLLPLLRPEEAHLLNQEQRAYLYHALNPNKPELSTSILQGLVRIGDNRAVPHIGKLIGQLEHSNADKHLMGIAQQAITALQQAAASQTLLRSSAQNLHIESLPRSSYAPSVPADAARPASKDGTP